jgi:hypothetical protein
MFKTTDTHKGDLNGRAEIERLVNTFYDRVRGDELLGFIFEKIAQTNWQTHLPKMYAFWETVLFRSGGYTGNPIAAHAKLCRRPRWAASSLTAGSCSSAPRWTISSPARKRNTSKLRRRHGERDLQQDQRRA